MPYEAIETDDSDDEAPVAQRGGLDPKLEGAVAQRKAGDKRGGVRKPHGRAVEAAVTPVAPVGIGAAPLPVPRIQKGPAYPDPIQLRALDAEEALPEIVEYLERGGATTDMVVIRVVEIAQTRITRGTFEMSLLYANSNVMPSDALRIFIEDEYQLPGNRPAVTYQIAFIDRRSMRILAQSKLGVDSAYQIQAMRRAAYNRRQAGEGGNGGSGGSGFGAAPSFPPAMQPRRQERYEQEPERRYAPSYDDSRGHAEFIQGQYQALLEETRRAAAEGRVARVPDEPRFAPPPLDEAALAQRITAAVVAQLAGHAGVGFGAAPVAPVAPAPVAAVPVSPLQAAFDEMQQSIITSALSKTRRAIHDSLNGVSEPAEETQPVVLEPAEKESKLPFTVEEIPGAKWSDGRPMMGIVDKETGEMSYDVKKLLMSNPAAIEKGMELAGGLLAFISNLAGVKPPAGAAQIVGRIPSAAQPADTGMGAAPEAGNGNGEGWPGG